MRVLIIDRHADPCDEISRYVQMAQRWKEKGVDVDILTQQYSPFRPEIPVQKGKTVLEKGGIHYIVLRNKPYRIEDKSFVSFVKENTWKMKYLMTRTGFFKPYGAVIVTSTMPSDAAALEKYMKKKKKVFLYDLPEIWPMRAIEEFGRSTKEKWMKYLLNGEHAAYCFTHMILSRIPYADRYLMAQNYHPHQGKYYTYLPEGVDLRLADSWNEPDMEAVRFFIQHREAGRRTFAAVHQEDTGDEIFPLLDAMKTRRERMALCIICPDGEKQRYETAISERGLEEVVRVFPKGDVKTWLSTLKIADVVYYSAQGNPLHRFGYGPKQLLQTMAAGRPLLYRVQASDDPIKTGVAGRSAEDFSPKALEKALDFMLDATPQALDFMGQNALRYLEKYHDIDRLAQQYLDILMKPYQKVSYTYKNVIGGKTVTVSDKKK